MLWKRKLALTQAQITAHHQYSYERSAYYSYGSQWHFYYYSGIAPY